MSAANDVIRGALKLDNFMESKCFTTWQDFIAAIPSMFSVEVPESITNVTVGNVQPGDSDRDHLWIRKDTAGSFMGLYIYAQGSWKKIYPAPNEIFLVYGDSRTLDPGYKVVTDTNVLTSTEIASLQKIWTVGGTTPTTWWTVFHTVFTGF